jgi:hypothetical protein
MANLHVHATLASAFQDESVGETPEQRSVRDAEFAVMNAILAFLAVLQSQNNLFQLGLEQDIDTVTRITRTCGRIGRTRESRAKVLR